MRLARGLQLKISYDKIYSAQIFSEPEYYYRWIIDLIRPKVDEKLLDVACGAGHLLKASERRGLVPTGLDFSNVALHLTKENTSASEVVLGVGEKLPFQNKSFDYVTCLGSLEHFLHPEVAIREISRVLKTNGLSIIVLPNAYFIKDIYMVWRKGSFPGYGQPLDRYNTLREWITILENNKLKVLNTFKYNPKWRIESFDYLVYRIFRPFIPLNLSYCFVFICKSGQMPEIGRPYMIKEDEHQAHRIKPYAYER
ncbi:MAG: methyltransferase domain-containing protein [Candidatus Bathyarchaeia archaeon]|jgi:ubiquinone/menaquinone biosynthesis C-methylase UbiE